jgi:ABC-type glycerol-3-phosphate transport system substrate-binding protein
MEEKKISRRDFLRMGALTSAGVILASCGTQPTEPEVPAVEEEPVSDAPPAQEPIKIVFGNFQAETDALGMAQAELWEKYEHRVPDTNIEWDLLLGYTTERVNADLAAGTPVDIFRSGYPDMTFPADEGLLANVGEMLRDDGWDFNDLIDGMEKVYTYNGNIWGFPYEQVVVLWAYNPQVFTDAGVDFPPKNWTWDDMIEIGTQVTKDTSGRHPDDPDFDINNVEVWAYAPWQIFVIQEYLPYTAGGSYLDETGTKVTVNNNAFVDTLQFLRDLYNKHYVATLKQPDKGLFTGAIGVQETGNWALVDFYNQMGDVGCLYTPVHPIAKVNATPFFDKSLFIPNQEDGDKISAAFQFGKWFAFGDPYLEFALKTGYFPFLKSHEQDPKWQDFIKDKPFIDVAMEMPSFAQPRTWTLFPKAPNESTRVLSELWDMAVYTEDDIPTALANAELELQSLLEEGE